MYCDKDGHLYVFWQWQTYAGICILHRCTCDVTNRVGYATEYCYLLLLNTRGKSVFIYFFTIKLIPTTICIVFWRICLSGKHINPFSVARSSSDAAAKSFPTGHHHHKCFLNPDTLGIIMCSKFSKWTILFRCMYSDQKPIHHC